MAHCMPHLTLRNGIDIAYIIVHYQPTSGNVPTYLPLKVLYLQQEVSNIYYIQYLLVSLYYAFNRFRKRCQK